MFGVMLWELTTLAQQPYLEVDPFEMSAYLRDGYRLAQPLNCPDELYVVLHQILFKKLTRYLFLLYFQQVRRYGLHVGNVHRRSTDSVAAQRLPQRLLQPLEPLRLTTTRLLATTKIEI